jgi:Ca2+/Na+ antiporter
MLTFKELLLVLFTTVITIVNLNSDLLRKALSSVSRFFSLPTLTALTILSGLTLMTLSNY